MAACVHCGAQLEDALLCKYCGRAVRSAETDEEDRGLVDALHAEVAAAAQDTERAAHLLRNGYLPHTLSGLMHAATRALALLDPDAHDSARPMAAAARVEAIAARIRAESSDARAATFAAEVEEKARAYLARARKTERRDMYLGCGCFVLVAAGLASAAYFVLS